MSVCDKQMAGKKKNIFWLQNFMDTWTYEIKKEYTYMYNVSAEGTDMWRNRIADAVYFDLFHVNMYIT